MNCKKAESYIVEYLYQELSAGKTVELEKHLSGCNRCTETLESWRSVHRSYQKIADHPQPSPYLKQRILAAAGEELRKGTPWTERLFLLAKVAALPVLIFGIAMLFYYPRKDDTMISQMKEEPQPSPAITGGEQTQAEPENRAQESNAPSFADRESKAMDELVARKDLAENDRLSDRDRQFRAAGLEKRSVLKKEGTAGSREEALDYDTGRSISAPSAPAAEPVPAEEMAESEYGDARQPEKSSAAPFEAPKQKVASKVTPASAEGLYEQSQVYFQQNEQQSGVSVAREAIKNDQDKALAEQFHQSGVDFQNKGEYGNAIIQFNLVVSNYPAYAKMDDVLLRLGDLYSQTGQLQDAESAYEKLSARQGQIKVQKLQDLKKKQEAQEQLKALGYVKE